MKRHYPCNYLKFLFFCAISSYLKLLAVIADEAVQMGFAGYLVPTAGSGDKGSNRQRQFG